MYSSFTRPYYSSYSSNAFSGHADMHRFRSTFVSFSQIVSVATDAIATLRKAGVSDACFVGGMACKLLGNSRQPNDLDILCLNTTLSQETIKQLLVSLNPKFYLVNPRNPSASYKVLWYLTDTRSRIKVDILLPGILNIPSFSASSITRNNEYSLPCAPFSVVLLLKLQAWEHHGDAAQLHYRAKQPTDMRDIDALLPIAIGKGIRPRTDKLLPERFVRESEQRVRRYIRELPSSKNQWKALGYDTHSSTKPAQSIHKIGRIDFDNDFGLGRLSLY